MNILVISQHYYPENFRITDICETLVKMGHTIDVICGLPNYPEGIIYDKYKNRKNREEVINGVNIHRCYEIGRGNSKIKLFLNYYSVCLSMKKKARKIKKDFDIVLVNQLSPVMVSWAGIKYAKKHNVPCIMYCYDLWPASLAAGGISNNSLIYKYYHRVSNKCYKKMDSILVTSKCFIEYLNTIHGIEKSKIEYLPQYCEDQFSNIAYKEKKDDTFNYVFAGNIGKVQSVETILKAANEIKEHKDIKIHIVGDGSNLENCKKIVEENQIDNVIFYGRKPLEEMNQYYELADAMLVTLTKNEIISKTLPGKVQSYMAAGKPIIASIDGETQIILDESQCGIYCDAEDYKKLSELFIKFKESNINQLALNSRKYYNEHFNKKMFFEKLLFLINRKLNEKGE